MSVYRALRQRIQSFSSSRTTFTLNGAESASRSSYRSVHAFSHRGYGCRAAVPDGSCRLLWSHFRGCGHTSHASGLRAMHCIAFSNYRQLGYHRDNTRITNDLKFKAVSGNRPRFYSGGLATWTLFGANLAIFAMWYKMDNAFMSRHFVVSFDGLSRGRYHTLITHAFSHYRLEHLLFNMFGLYCFGGLLEKVIGGPALLMQYFAGAIFASMGHIFYYAYVYPIMQKIPLNSYNVRSSPGALGASGSVTSFIIFYILLYPTHTLYLLFIPMPAALAGCLIVGRDVYLAIRGRTNISVGGHLGGALQALFLYSSMKFCDVI